VILEAITGMAMRKLGLPGPHYLDASTSGQQPFSTAALVDRDGDG